MIIEKSFITWRAFDQFLEELSPTPQDPPPEPQPRIQVIRRGSLLFRGQSSAGWKLETTLDRASKTNFSTDLYQSILKSLKTELEVFSDRLWNWEEQSELLKSTEAAVQAPFLHWQSWPGHNLANFALMSYLRHHGFPSPLLDWTRSKYIAAYFGAAELSSEPWSIYVFDERPKAIKIASLGNPDPNISVISKSDTFHRRHFLQQSVYTICTRFEKFWLYTPFDQAVVDSSRTEQDIVYKCVFPPEARLKVVAMLNDMNINAFSLFGGEEALLKTLALRAFQRA